MPDASIPRTVSNVYLPILDNDLRKISEVVVVISEDLISAGCRLRCSGQPEVV